MDFLYVPISLVIISSRFILDSLLDEENNCDQHSLDQHFHDNFSNLVTSPMFQCEEVSTHGKFEWMRNETTSEKG